MAIHKIYNAVNRHFRRQRMQEFIAEFRPGPKTKILDLGGTPYNWTFVSETLQVTLLNLKKVPEIDARSGLSFVEADARELPFADTNFDIVFSNSLVEHLGTLPEQERFAREARRVGRKLWIQTPAKSFPIEPHFLTPFIHFLPKQWRRRLLRNFTIWGLVTRPNSLEVDSVVEEVRLLARSEMRRLFPDCEIRTERFIGLPKSYIAVRH